MEGYYAEKTWSAFESHGINTFCERNVCEEGGVLENKTRAVSDPPKRMSKKRKISGNWKSKPLKWVALRGDWFFIACYGCRLFLSQKFLSFALLKRNPETYLNEFQAWLEYQTSKLLYGKRTVSRTIRQLGFSAFNNNNNNALLALNTKRHIYMASDKLR